MAVFNDNLLPSDWRPSDRRTLVYVVEESRVLLIEKLTGHGKGLVNAPGGKVEEGESPADCADRELLEEVGVESQDKQLCGLLRFVDMDEGFNMFGFVYVCKSFSGTPSKSREANPFWCEVAEVPFDRMWEGDKLWLSFILKGRCLAADLIFKDGGLKWWSLHFHSSERDLQREGDDAELLAS